MYDSSTCACGLRSDEAATLPAPPIPLESPKTEGGKGWLAVTLVGGIALPLLAALVLGVVFYLRRRKPAPPSNPSAAFVSIACPDCGKKLKVKAALAGKKVRCGQCGKAVLVAERDEA